MIGKLKQFSIFDLWGDKQVILDFKDNKLILVGENGSGKTTILRIVYETLACKWSMLSVEDFSRIELIFQDNKMLKISKSKLLSARELFLEADSSLLREFPPMIRRVLNERSSISGRDISYDQILEILEEYDYTDLEIYHRINEKLYSVEKNALLEYSNVIKEKIGCSIIYLPTYRRVEKRIGYVNERDYQKRHMGYKYRLTNQVISEERSIEIAKTGMDDVDYFISMSLDDIRKEANISASRLNYQCFKGILNKTSDNVKYNKEILSEEEIEKIFGSINEDVLSSAESIQIKQQLMNMQSLSAPMSQPYDRIVYYFYSMLHDRYIHLREKEKIILSDSIFNI